MFCVALCELKAHPEQSLLCGLVVGDLVAVHGAGDEPHGQVIIAREGEEEAIKPKQVNGFKGFFQESKISICTFHSDIFVF